MNAILTGSQVYGRPDAASDLDMVVLVTPDELKLFKSLGEVTEPEAGSDSDPGTTGRDDGLQASVRFGKLNLIVTTCPIAFAVWQRGTDDLRRCRGKVSRDAAIYHFRKLRVQHGLKDVKEQT